MKKSMKSLKFRIFINILLLAGLVIGIFCGISIFLMKKYTHDVMIREFSDVAKMVSLHVDGDIHALLGGTENDLQNLSGLQNSISEILENFPEISAVSSIRIKENNFRNILTMKSGSDLNVNLDPIPVEEQKIILENFSGNSEVLIKENPYLGVKIPSTSSYSPILRSDGSLEGILKVDFVVDEFKDFERRNFTFLLTTVSGIFLFSIGISFGIAEYASRLLKNFSSEIMKNNFTENEINFPSQLPTELSEVQDMLNKLGSRYKKSVVDVEQNFNYRFRELENKIDYFEKTAVVCKAVMAELDEKILYQAIVEHIQEQFSFYFVGLYLYDDSLQAASLKAGTGKAGLQLLQRRHRVLVGEGLVGEAIESGQTKVSLDFSKDSFTSTASELPLSRTEAVLPLFVRSSIFGAISIHSEQAGKFNKAFLTILEILADYVAIAIENAGLFAEIKHELETTGYSENESLNKEIYNELPHIAQQDKILSNITSRIRSTTTTNIILRTALIELAEALNVSKASVHLKTLHEGFKGLPEDEQVD